MDTPESELVIDGISLTKVDRQALRERLIALPQDPVFLPDGSTVEKTWMLVKRQQMMSAKMHW